MKLRLLVDLAGNPFRQAGDVIECEESEAGRMIASRFAIPVSIEPAIERAVKSTLTETRKRKG